jgi:hypothetical protein
MSAIKPPIVEPFCKDGEVKYFVGITGASKKLVFSRSELAALRSLIELSLEANRARAT